LLEICHQKDAVKPTEGANDEKYAGPSLRLDHAEAKNSCQARKGNDCNNSKS